MAAKTVHRVSKAKHKKDVKRKNKTMFKNKQLDIIERAISRARHASERGKTIKSEIKSEKEAVDSLVEQLKNFMPFLGFLTFTQKLIEDDVIKSFKLNINLVDTFNNITGISKRIKNIPLLEQDIVAMELLETSSIFQDIATDIYNEISRLEPVGDKITDIASRIIPSLPEEFTTGKSKEQLINLVFELSRIDFIKNNIEV